MFSWFLINSVICLHTICLHPTDRLGLGGPFPFKTHCWVHTKLPPCKIVNIFFLDWAGSGCESEGCTAVFNAVWTVILRSFNNLAMCCMKRFIRGVDNAQFLSHTLWFRTERQAEEKEGRETDSEHKDKEMMITLVGLYEHTSWS